MRARAHLNMGILRWLISFFVIIACKFYQRIHNQQSTISTQRTFLKDKSLSVNCLEGSSVHWINIEPFEISDGSDVILEDMTKEECLKSCHVRWKWNICLQQTAASVLSGAHVTVKPSAYCFRSYELSFQQHTTTEHRNSLKVRH